MTKAKSLLLQKITGGQTCQLTGIFADLVADHLYKEGKSVENLSAILSCPSESLLRFLRACECLGLVKENDSLFHSTEEGLLLSSFHPESMQIQAVYKASDLTWKPLLELKNGILKGENPFRNAFGVDLFNYLSNDPQARLLYDAAMASYAERSTHFLLGAFDFTNYKSIIDIGGGKGAFLLLLKRYAPQARLVNFDLPSAEKGYSNEGIEYSVGDFFTEIPKGFGLYILRNILHDWDDERALEILLRCVEAMDEASELCVIETVISPNSGNIGRFADISMFLIGGKERTEKELKELLSRAGLSCIEKLESPGAKTLFRLKKEF